MSSHTQKIVKKSRHWHRHGGHIPWSMRVYEERERQRAKRRVNTVWFGSVADLFKKK